MEITIHLGGQKLSHNNDIAYQYKFPFYEESLCFANNLSSFIEWSNSVLYNITTINIIIGNININEILLIVDFFKQIAAKNTKKCVFIFRFICSY